MSLLARVVDVKPGELKAALLACLYFFLLLSSYFILRPIRDAMGVAAGVSKLPWLFAGTLGAMLIAQPIYALLVARMPVRRFIPVTYQFFAANLIAFFALQRFGPPTWQLWTGPAFFIWTSVFALFVPSVFWSFMVDHFEDAQAKRLFGFIGVGGTIGSILGSATTATLAKSVGPTQLLLVSAVLLELAVGVVWIFPRHAERPTHAAPVGGNAWEGITLLLRSRYLAAIAGFLFLYTLGSTVLYFEQTDAVGKAFNSTVERTEVLARMELAAQVLAVVTQAFLTGRVLRWIGVAATLAIMPAVSVLGFAGVGWSAGRLGLLFWVIVLFGVIRRGSNFALTNPAMEILFTAVDRPTKFKAKSFIETFVYRAGDQIAAWGYHGLSALGLSLGAIAWVSAPLSAVFLALGVWLGRRHQRLVDTSLAR